MLKFLLCNVLESGKSVISLDSEHEMEALCGNLGGSFVDLLSGRIRINLLEPKHWDDGSEPDDPDAPAAFRGTLLAQHISTCVADDLRAGSEAKLDELVNLLPKLMK